MSGYIGFCWGSWIGVRILSEDKDHIFKAGVNCHPSFGIEGKFTGDFKSIADKARAAIFLAPAGNDPADVKPDGEIVHLFEKNNPGKVLSKEYPQQKHGFVVRGDLSDEQTAKDVHDVLATSNDFFKKYL